MVQCFHCMFVTTNLDLTNINIHEKLAVKTLLACEITIFVVN